MVSIEIDLTNDSEYALAQQNFAIDAYLPPFAKHKLSKDTQKAINTNEVRKQLKKIRTNIVITETKQSKHLSALLAIIVSSIVDIKIAIQVSAKKGAIRWESLSICTDFSAIAMLSKQLASRLVQSAENLGQFHSKPFNTLSSIQFCRDVEYSATGDYGFTENQLDNTTANLSISGGSNAFSAYYAILITRINRQSLAEQLTQNNTLALKIQEFFKQFIDKQSFIDLQKNIKTSLHKTASDIGDELHIMDKQIMLPQPNKNGGCDYINITPIINPTLFSASSNRIFYIKNQSVKFIQIPLGGTNPSNAGTAVGEVAGQNSRLQMTFPEPQTNKVQQYLLSFNQWRRCFWSKALKQQINSNLLQYRDNQDISKEQKRMLLKKVVAIAIEELLHQIQEIHLYLQSLNTTQYQTTLEFLHKDYYQIFSPKKETTTPYDIGLKTLKSSFRQLPIYLDFDESALILEIVKQFQNQIHHKGGL